MPTSKSNGQPKHRAMLREKGWSYRVGAQALGVNFTHLHRVLKGERQSQRLLAAIEALPVRKTAKYASGAGAHPFSPAD